MKKNDEDEVGVSPSTLGELQKGCISPFVSTRISKGSRSKGDKRRSRRFVNQFHEILIYRPLVHNA